jgi:3-hydroxybutyryl-CoA dehydratase
MAKRPAPAAGDVITWERAFTVEEVKEFARLSGDDAVHHMVPDDQGRIMVQGLLTMTLPTKIGGELDFIASDISYQFLRPVFVGQTIRCRLRILVAEREAARWRLEIETICYNSVNKEVLKGVTRGVIRDK